MAFAFLRKDLFSQSPTIGHLQAKSAVLMTTSNVDHLLVSVMKTYPNGDLKDKREREKKVVLRNSPSASTVEVFLQNNWNQGVT